MSPDTIATIKATVPVLQAHGEQLTRLFYQRMFENNPEVGPFFNQAHQKAGSQQKALAGAICAYAENIDNPAALAAAVELIAQKHASLGIRAEHYPIVGQNLLAAIKELLGDAATDDIVNAWAEAYQVLADIFIEREAEIYRNHEQHHGWQGFKPFKVIKREDNSRVISSFYLQPADDQPLNPHQAGQYITIRVPVAEDTETMRNYSLSNKPGEDYYRISVKRETARRDDAPHGVVSNFLHDQLGAGDTIWVGPPCGEFTIRTPVGKPMVMIAGGVGITPLLSMLHASLDNNNDDSPVTLIQAAVNGETLAFADEIAELENKYGNFDWHIRYSEPTDNDRYQGRFHSEGLIDEDLIASVDTSADFYLCGPNGMMQHCHQLLTKAGVPAEQIHLEAFGPALQLAG
ncbi:NO-inducible flavohemoprotein [Methylophaga sp.]|uniref:NO-inducible flavohemoprotein n=1 Tax=Methylophaga sp. TaxID=2024840 RepID=UPI0025CE3D71|nr:NO-inducible flavohemoprotein [Methylophaga sp.]